MSADEGVIDPGTRETLASGRRTVGEMLGAAQSDLRRIFVVFLVGFLVSFYAMRIWIWPTLKADLLARGASVVVITPFDVIMLQAKLGILAGIVVSIPFFLYYAREPLKRRGWYPKSGVARWKLVGIGVLSALLFAGGTFYSYTVFFPVMFEFLASNAINAGLNPTYSIVHWTQFILVLGLSFGLAAQLPLAMTALSYTGIVPYETFRDNWRYAVIGMFGFGALFSPPDPFTQVMWAGPLVVLYGFSLYLARTAVAFRRGSDPEEMRAAIRSNANRIAALAVLGGGLAAWLATEGVGYVNRVLLPRLPAKYRPDPLAAEALRPLPGTTGLVVVALAGALVLALLGVLYYAWSSVDPDGSGAMGDPTAIDIEPLDAEGVRAAPPEVFAEMDEETVMEHANAAMDADNPEKARALLDRFDEVEAAQTEEGDEEEAPEPGRVERATAGVIDSVTGDEPPADSEEAPVDGEPSDDDEVGGYYYDLVFILDSIRSRAFYLFVVFAAVLSVVFFGLNRGGLGAIKRDFIDRLPETVHPEEVSVVTLHPVEALVFEIKIATLLGAVATLPLLLYFAWPALKERGLAGGDRRVLLVWTGAITLGLVGGSALGYFVVAPAVISYLVWDALQANMRIVYRVSNFAWLVFFTTVGIGIWIDIPVSMLLFRQGGLVTYRTMRNRWREVTMAVVVFAAFFTPSNILSMILVAIPVMLGYGLGLAILWLVTLGGRRESDPDPETAPGR